MRHYAHIGTGNYNPKTARLYTDLGLFTADPEIGADIAEMFNYLTGYSRPPPLPQGAGRPVQPQGGILREIERTIEAHSPERARADPDEDERAARRAVDPGPLSRLAGRGAGRAQRARDLRPAPGVPGVSENIEVVSVVGRFLEHSRIYSFERPGERGARLHRVGRT